MNKRGVSLIESLIALLILLIGLTGTAAAFQQRTFQNLANKNQATAAMIAQTVADEMSLSDPDNWDSSALQDAFQFDFEGNRSDTSGNDPYYKVEVSWEPNANWYQVTIGVTWTGWSKEAEKVNTIENAEFAYVLDVSMAAAYGDAN